jgi:hypothetical protein
MEKRGGGRGGREDQIYINKKYIYIFLKRDE